MAGTSAAGTLVIFRAGVPHFMITLRTLAMRGPEWAVLFLVVGAMICSAQTSSSPSSPPQSSDPNSVAAAVRDSKAQKTSHAKKVITDDDLTSVATGPFPRLKMDSLDNSDQIIREIGNYKKTHTAEETEQAVHDWFHEYDDQLFTAIQDNKNRSILMQENQANGNDLCQESGDYEQCRNRQISEARGARNDWQVMARNNALIHRLQNALMKIRNGIAFFGLRYDWFKVRTTNDIDSI